MFGSEVISETLRPVRVKVQLEKCRLTLRLLAHEHARTEITYPGFKNVAQVLSDKGLFLADKHIMSNTLRGIDVLIGEIT